MAVTRRGCSLSVCGVNPRGREEDSGWDGRPHGSNRGEEGLCSVFTLSGGSYQGLMAGKGPCMD